jgi:hypothetical protein
MNERTTMNGKPVFTVPDCACRISLTTAGDGRHLLHSEGEIQVQAFLSYIWDGKQTYFTALKERSFKGLLPEKCEVV